MRFQPLVTVAVVLGFLSGCAQKSEDISATYVSPMQYSGYSCRQIQQEAARVSAHAAEVMGVQDRRAKNDVGVVAVSAIVFWPAAFFVKGDSETAGEVARLKGEMRALEQASIQKGCDIDFRPATPVEPTAEGGE